MVTEGKSPDVTARLLAVRATVNLPGLFFDHVACVDPEREGIREYLTAGYLVALPQTQQHHCDGIEIARGVQT
jgi:hypothetical protein